MQLLFFLIVLTEWNCLNTEKQLILLFIFFLVRVKLPNTQIHTFQANMTEWGHYGYDTLCIFGTVGKFSRTAAVAWNTYGQYHPFLRGKSRTRLLVKDKIRSERPLETGVQFRIPMSCSEIPAFTQPCLHTVSAMCWPGASCRTVVYTAARLDPHCNIPCEL